MNGAFRVGEFLIEPQLNTIAGTDKTTRIEPKVMQVLVCLAEGSREVVSKERLMHSVWPDTFVTDDVLTRAISELRKAFRDEAKEPRFIQTIPRGGYRLIAPVFLDDAEHDVAAQRLVVEVRIRLESSGVEFGSRLLHRLFSCPESFG